MALIGWVTGLAVCCFAMALLLPVGSRAERIQTRVSTWAGRPQNGYPYGTEGDRWGGLPSDGSRSAPTTGGRTGRGMLHLLLRVRRPSASGERTKRAAKGAFGENAHWHTLEVWLRRAGVAATPLDVAVRWFVVTACLTVVASLTPLGVGSLLLPPLSFLVAVLYLRARMARQLQRFEGAVSELLVIVVNALRAGHSLMQAIHLCAEQSDGPMQVELRRAERELQMGAAVEAALEGTAARVGSQDFALIATAVGIQRQVGGNLAEVLERISETITDRIRLRREVRALTAQGRLSAAIFMGLPAAVGGFLYLLNPPYIRVLFTSAVGLGLLVCACAGQVVGFLLIRRIVRVE
ncbi:MAG: type II secretion system F family protein [Alicyclobacillus sp.]|nr:type II secretion system F family protein [Alicyclobacillus sp.]